MPKFDIFISYRRAGSEDFARAVYQELIHKKYKVLVLVGKIGLIIYKANIPIV